MILQIKKVSVDLPDLRRMIPLKHIFVLCCGKCGHIWGSELSYDSLTGYTCPKCDYSYVLHGSPKPIMRGLCNRRKIKSLDHLVDSKFLAVPHSTCIVCLQEMEFCLGRSLLNSELNVVCNKMRCI